MSSPHLEDPGTTDALRKFEIFAVKGTRAQALELIDKEFIQKNLGMGPAQVHIVAPRGSTQPVRMDMEPCAVSELRSTAQAARVDPCVFAETYWSTYVRQSTQSDAQVVGYARKPLPNQVPMRVFKSHKPEDPVPEGIFT